MLVTSVSKILSANQSELEKQVVSGCQIVIFILLYDCTFLFLILLLFLNLATIYTHAQSL